MVVVVVVVVVVLLAVVVVVVVVMVNSFLFTPTALVVDSSFVRRPPRSVHRTDASLSMRQLRASSVLGRRRHDAAAAAAAAVAHHPHRRLLAFPSEGAAGAAGGHGCSAGRLSPEVQQVAARGAALHLEGRQDAVALGIGRHQRPQPAPDATTPVCHGCAQAAMPFRGGRGGRRRRRVVSIDGVAGGVVNAALPGPLSVLVALLPSSRLLARDFRFVSS